MFTNDQIDNIIRTYGVSADTHSARLIALADMLTIENATLDDIILAVRHAVACDSLGVSRETLNAKIERATERITGYSESTLARYSIVLGWLESARAESETMPELLESGAFTLESLSALVQLAAGKVGSRKLVSDAISGAISKRNNDAIVATYRRLLAATKAKSKAKADRAKSAKAVESPSDSKSEAAPRERTAEEILSELSIPAMANLLMARIAAEADTLSEEENEQVADAMAQIEAMILA